MQKSEVKNILEQCKDYGLTAPRTFYECSNYFSDGYNFNKNKIIILFKNKNKELYNIFIPALFIYNYEYMFSDHSKYSFNRANKNLYWNCIDIINEKYIWLYEPIIKLKSFFYIILLYFIIKKYCWEYWHHK